MIAERTAPLHARAQPGDVPAYVASAVRLNHRLASLPLSHGNVVTLLEDYAGSIAALTAAGVEDRYRAMSSELTLEEWSRRGPGKRYVDTVMRLTAALQ